MSAWMETQKRHFQKVYGNVKTCVEMTPTFLDKNTFLCRNGTVSKLFVSKHRHLNSYLYCKRSDQLMATVHIYRNRQGMKGLHHPFMALERDHLVDFPHQPMCYPAKPSYSHCVELGRSDCHFSTATRVKKTVTPPTDKKVTVLALVS